MYATNELASPPLGGEQATVDGEEKLFNGNLREINEHVLLEALHNFASKAEYMKVLIRFDRAEITTVNGLNDLQSKFHQWLKNLVRNLRNSIRNSICFASLLF
jgi:hypothetical protein